MKNEHCNYENPKMVNMALQVYDKLRNGFRKDLDIALKSQLYYHVEDFVWSQIDRVVQIKTFIVDVEIKEKLKSIKFHT